MPGETKPVPCVDTVNRDADGDHAMTYAAPSFDFYDDGLVHSHDWSRNTPPGTHHAEGRRGVPQGRPGREHEESTARDR
jgi:hypothetical protein